MKNAVVNELISTMREVTPKEGNLANVLMDLLCMSKEAIYRRLRGEVAFTKLRLLPASWVYRWIRLLVTVCPVGRCST